MLASQEIDFDATPERRQQPSPVLEANPEPQNPLAQRLMETVDFDVDALRQFTVAGPAASTTKAEAPETAVAPKQTRTHMNVGEWIEHGFACFRRKDYGGAVRHWEQAKSADPGNKTLNYNLKLARARLAGQERPSAFRAARSGKA